MTVLNPEPADKPDWYNASAYATELNQEAGGPDDSHITFPPSYIGNAPAYGFRCNVTGGPWELWLTFSNVPPGVLAGFTSPQYQGYTDCLIQDNVPTPSAWVQAEVFCVDSSKPVSATLQWWLSQTADPGATVIPAQGLVIDGEGVTCPHGEVTNIPSSVLLPGIHQWCLDVETNLTGVANLSGLFNATLKGRMVRQFNPVADVGYDGQVIVSGIQPVWQISNEGGADVVVNATLTRGF